MDKVDQKRKERRTDIQQQFVGKLAQSAEGEANMLQRCGDEDYRSFDMWTKMQRQRREQNIKSGGNIGRLAKKSKQ